MTATGRAATALNANRRTRQLAELGETRQVDVLVIGGGITGVGVALDAASRGLSVVLVERRDLAHGTSRFSSKLAHGGLRYLAKAQFAVALESAFERHILALRTAPHLVRPYRQVVPFTPHVSRMQAATQQLGMGMGDVLRAAAHTPASYLPASRRLTARAVRMLAPAVSPAGLRGGLQSFDCRIVDDARLVVALARTAAGFGATILTRVAVTEARGDGATLRDELTGETMTVRARAVISATGVWAAQLDPAIRLRPSRGTHLVLRREQLARDVALLAPVPGTISRFVFVLPADLGRSYLGLTDVETDGQVPDVAQASDAEIDFLLDTINPVLTRPLTRADVLGTFAGLRPLLDAGADSSADLSRRHAIIRSDSGLFTIVGGKLTTYRAMARDVLDRAIADTGLACGPCRTENLPAVGSGRPSRIAAIQAPRFGQERGLAPMAARFGVEAERICADYGSRAGRLEPVGPGLSVTRAELEFSVAEEGALSVDDLLDRRTRIGLVHSDRQAAHQAAAEALAASAASS